MVFDFFKKRGGKARRGDDDLFDPAEDALDFDELEASGEFIDDGNYAPPSPPPAPTYHPSPRTPAPRAPQPPTQAAPPRPAPPPPPAPPRPAPPEYDDLTVVSPLPPRPASGAPEVPPPSAPVPPGRPTPRPVTPPRTPRTPPSPQAAPPPSPQPPRPAPPQAQPTAPPPGRVPPPPADHDDVTMIMSNPVGADCLVAWLVVASGPHRGLDFRLPGGTARIGHEPGCDVCIVGDTFISSCHAEISFRQGQYEIRDLASTNGTFVNEVRVNEAALHDNDRVRLGVTQLVFKSLSL